MKTVETLTAVILILQILQCTADDTLENDELKTRIKRQLYPSLIGTMFGPVYRPMYVRKSLVRRTPWGPQVLNPSVPLYPWW